MEWLNNFEKIGHWKLDDTSNSHKVVSHLKGINFVIEDKEKALLKHVVYVFKTESEVVYIGETTRSVEERLENYRYGFAKLKDTDNRVKEEITKLLQNDEIVEIYILQPKLEYEFYGEKIDLFIAKSLEAHLISKYSPRINKKENKSIK